MEQYAGNWEDYSQEAFLLGKNPSRSHKIELAKRISGLKASISCDRFPTDIDKLARKVGIVMVRHVPLANRGCLLREPCGFVVEINCDLSCLERRFVLAHEITHLLIERDRIVQSSRRFERNGGRVTLGYKQIEELCDFGAREILMPLNSVRAEIRRSKPNLSLVMELSREAQCAVAVTVEQICQPIMLWDCTFVLWAEQQEGFVARKIWPRTYRRVELVDDKNSLVRRALGTSEAVTGDEAMDFMDRVDSFPAQAVRHDSHSVLLMIYRSLG